MHDTNYPYILQNRGPRFQGVGEGKLNQPPTGENAMVLDSTALVKFTPRQRELINIVVDKALARLGK